MPSAADPFLLETGAAYWREHAPDDRGGMVDAVPVHDAAEERDHADEWLFLLLFREYHEPGGLILRPADQRAAVETVTAVAEQQAESIGEDLSAGRTDPPGWRDAMGRLVDASHAATGLIGAGGLGALTAATSLAIADRIAFQQGHLDEFLVEIEAGQPLDGRFLAQCVMYATGTVGTFERVRRVGDLLVGYRWERRRTHSSHSCGPCIGYADRGWVRAGTLPDIGDECDCLSNCLCSFERAKGDKPPGGLAMAIKGLDPEACRRRNALAARRGLNAAPVQLHVAAPTGPDGFRLIGARGKLPPTDEAAVARINLMLGLAGSHALTVNDVWILYPEVANTNFVGDRYMFLDVSTLKNFASEAADGFAFMNSHRTGGLSQPTELPYGRTFAGRFETWAGPGGESFARTVLGVYMIRGQHPNGANGPSTDDLYRGIAAGTIFDVSMGFAAGGTAVCDVCGNELDALDVDGDGPLCPHIPGTHHAMSEEDVAAQKVRGVPDGAASYSLIDAHASEVSAVFDGAVPGAGFRKAIRLYKGGALSGGDLDRARRAFAPLLRDGDLGVSVASRYAPLFTGRDQPGEGIIMDLTKLSAAELLQVWTGLGRPPIDLATLAASLEGQMPPRPGAAPAPPRPGPGAPAPQPNPNPYQFSGQHANPPQAGFAPTPQGGFQLPPPPGQSLLGPAQGYYPLAEPPRPMFAVAPHSPGGPAPQGAPTVDSLQAELAWMRNQWDARETQREEEQRQLRLRSLAAEAKQFAMDMVGLRHAVPAETANLEADYLQAAQDDLTSPVQVQYLDPTDNRVKLGGRVDVLRARLRSRPQHNHTSHLTAGNPANRPQAAPHGQGTGFQPSSLSTLVPGDPSQVPDDTDGEELRRRLYAGAFAWGARMNGGASGQGATPAPGMAAAAIGSGLAAPFGNGHGGLYG